MWGLEITTNPPFLAPSGAHWKPYMCLLWVCFLGSFSMCCTVAPGPRAPGLSQCKPGCLHAWAVAVSPSSEPAVVSLPRRPRRLWAPSRSNNRSRQRSQTAEDKHKSLSWLGVLRSAGCFSPPYFPPGWHSSPGRLGCGQGCDCGVRLSRQRQDPQEEFKIWVTSGPSPAPTLSHAYLGKPPPQPPSRCSQLLPALLPRTPASPLPSLASAVPVATDAGRCWGFPSLCAWNSQSLSRELLPAAPQDTHHPLLLKAPSSGAATWMWPLQLGSGMPWRSSLLFCLLSISRPLPSPTGSPLAPQINGIHLGTLHRPPKCPTPMCASQPRNGMRSTP